jgi:hypothetical protein
VGKTLPRKPVHNPRQGGGKRRKVRTEKRENRRKDEVTWRANAAHSVCHEEKEKAKQEKNQATHRVTWSFCFSFFFLKRKKKKDQVTRRANAAHSVCLQRRKRRKKEKTK